MAKKVTIELTVVEADHLRAALSLAQDEHTDDFGRKNTALTRVQSKLEAAYTEAKREQSDDEGDPADDADDEGK